VLQGPADQWANQFAAGNAEGDWADQFANQFADGTDPNQWMEEFAQDMDARAAAAEAGEHWCHSFLALSNGQAVSLTQTNIHFPVHHACQRPKRPLTMLSSAGRNYYMLHLC